MTSVIFESGSTLETIQGYAFQATGITTITIPSSVIVIGEGAFYSSNLASVIFEDATKITTFGNSVFQDIDSNPTFTFQTAEQSSEVNSNLVSQINGTTGANIYYQRAPDGIIHSTYGITYTKTSDLSLDTAIVSAYDGSVPIVVVQDSVQIAGTPHTVINIEPNPTIEYTKATIDWEVYYDRYPGFAANGYPRTLDWVWSEWTVGGEAAGRIMTLTPTYDNIDWEVYYDRYPNFALNPQWHPRTLDWVWSHWTNYGKNEGRIMTLKPKLFKSNLYLHEITIPSSITTIYNNIKKYFCT